MKKRVEADKRAKALRLHHGGMSLREIGRQVGASHQTISNWVRQAESEAPPLPEAPPPEPTTEPADLPEDPIARLEMLVAESHANAREARALGNSASCQKSLRDAAAFESILARVRKQAASDGDTVRFSKADIEEGMREVQEKFAVLLARPLTCARCTRIVSGQFAGYDEAAIDRLGESGR